MTRWPASRTVGDSKGYLWKITIDKHQGIGRIEKISGLVDHKATGYQAIDGTEYPLNPHADVFETMQSLTSKIGSRFEAA